MTLQQVNFLNIGLMVVSAAIALFIPYELFLFSYAVLGPLHYLTEISWLHDRKYFTTGRYDWLFLTLPAIPISLAVFVKVFRSVELSGALIAMAFLAAVGMTFLKSPLHKILLGWVCVLATVALTQFKPLVVLFAILVPTIVHVFVFTGAFILFGALKAKSKSGLLSFAIFLLCAAVCFLVPLTGNELRISEYVRGAIEPFLGLHRELLSMFELREEPTQLATLMRFVAYAYTYHYLNWFSKTRVINWHHISGRRLVVILALYTLSIGAYAVDYLLGFLMLSLLSLIHVLLEFPLNHRSFVGIAAEFPRFLKAERLVS